MIVIITAVMIGAILICNFLDIDLFATMSGMSKGQETSFQSAEQLESNKAYVWNHESGNIKDDIEGTAETDIFFTCIKGDYNFKNKEKEEELDYPRSIWILADEDENIPTVTKDDYLIYVSETEVPDGILFERFADYGYTIGISNLMEDGSGHYYFTYCDTDEDDYKYFIDENSDAVQIAGLDPVTKIYLDKIGEKEIRKNIISDGGTVLGLTKGKSYICQFYTGTFYQDFMMTANVHSFSSLERFTSYDYEFMHSNFIVIKIPEYFKSGYYLVNGVGLFRYVADEDSAIYNGKAYDAAVDWNDPIILYNEDGTVKYDPSNPDFEEDTVSDESNQEALEETVNDESNPGVFKESFGDESESEFWREPFGDDLGTSVTTTGKEQKNADDAGDTT